MPPRFMERMQRQSEVYRSVYGEPKFDPPPYPFSRSRTDSAVSKASESSSVASRRSKSSAPPPAYQTHPQSKVCLVEEPSLPRNSLVLVTGASTFQGTHICDQLLKHGYKVRGVVPNPERAVTTAKFFADKYTSGRYTTAIIPNTARQGAFDIAARTCSGIIHVPEDSNFDCEPHTAIPPVIASAINALEAAARESTVRRFVYCSSTTAAANSGNGRRSNVTSDNWNTAAFTAAWEPRPNTPERAWAVYAAGKMQTEQAVWRWHRDRRPNFVLNCVLPAMVWGKILDPQNQGFDGSIGILRHIFDGEAQHIAWTPPQYFADVEDSALVHVAALILPGIINERLFVATTPYNISSILQLLRDMYPDRKFPGDFDHGADLTRYEETWRSEDLLRRMGKIGWTDMETSIGMSCESFV